MHRGLPGESRGPLVTVAEEHGLTLLHGVARRRRLLHRPSRPSLPRIVAQTNAAEQDELTSVFAELRHSAGRRAERVHQVPYDHVRHAGARQSLRELRAEALKEGHPIARRLRISSGEALALEKILVAEHGASVQTKFDGKRQRRYV